MSWLKFWELAQQAATKVSYKSHVSVSPVEVESEGEEVLSKSPSPSRDQKD